MYVENASTCSRHPRRTPHFWTCLIQSRRCANVHVSCRTASSARIAIGPVQSHGVRRCCLNSPRPNDHVNLRRIISTACIFPPE